MSKHLTPASVRANIPLPETATVPTGGINVGDELTLEVCDLAFGGEGVCRVENFVIFVPFTIPGEKITAQVTEVKRQYARAKLLKVLEVSPEREKPRCKYYGVCGGCQYQHIQYEAQLKYKHKQISDIFNRLGGFAESKILPVMPNPSPWNYRNRIMIRSQWNKHIQGLHIGFIEHDCGLVVDIEECAIVEPEINRLITHVRQNPPPRGGLKVVLRKEPENWQVGKDSFFQNNFHMLPGMIGALKDCLADSGVRYLYDIYCGVGFLGIELAAQVESFVGIEVDKQAINSARVNAERHGVTKGEFVVGSAEEVLPEYINRYPAGESCVILDPPRRGCHPSILTLLREIRPRQILYVSCHPATLARDLKNLCAEGLYELRQIQPMDMFSQTQHVECAADLRLKS
ncbi:MAG: class I SAM-dependent RNA methyltransferase [Verrucomicrobia bacterium]|nr:class I SAM-dependent RNA methyltransferase [Verrucomicrobiota bacterium]